MALERVNYQRTANDWLRAMTPTPPKSRPSWRASMAPGGLWMRRWRLFFLATAGLFGARRGADWGVSHFRLPPV